MLNKRYRMLTIAVVLAETNGFALFKNYTQLLSYAGLDVVERESGTSSGKIEISKKGNGHLRRATFMPAFSAVRHKEKLLLDLFNRTYARHGIKMKSYVAVQKKLLVLIYHIWKKNEKFDPNYTLTKALLQEEQKLFLEESWCKKIASIKLRLYLINKSPKRKKCFPFVK